MQSHQRAGLKGLPSDARPREKLLARGPAALGDAELLALLLRTGMAGKHVLQLAQELLDTFGGIAGLLATDVAALKAIKGLGPAKQAEIAAVMEIARRALAQPLQQRALLNDPQDATDFLRLQLGDRPHEVFALLLLDSQHRLIAFEELFRGTVNQASVYPREVVLRALHHQAAAVVLAHNHPSGLAEPSAADVALTRNLIDALALVGVRVLDHIVVTRARTASLAQLGLL
ncbi:MAG: RadC family protein [Hydrogenophaga sp.]|uniref:RadC family protein n=1 Tax=Hydrogenophaga intermedia TaxID=65786 RepID=UPI002043BAA8|nr:DNA repair protein RadC [Hydrogenophaga intermedia]MCM3564065.1 DNA repair protein RadC [Hydrogenophaga intermedia]